MSFLSVLNRSLLGGYVEGVQIMQSGNGSFQLTGELSYSNVSNIYKQTAVLFKQNNESIEIDLSGVTYSDSAGIALLVEWLSEARNHNKVINFVNLPQQMLEMVKISSLERVLPIS